MTCPSCSDPGYENTLSGTTTCYSCKREVRLQWIEGIHFKYIDPKKNNGMKAELLRTMVHRGPDGLKKTMKRGMRSDLATNALDIDTESEFTHDAFCEWPHWDDGTAITNWQASREFREILIRNGHWKSRAWIRHFGTFLFGGKRIKKQVGWLIPWRSRK